MNNKKYIINIVLDGCGLLDKIELFFIQNEDDYNFLKLISTFKIDMNNKFQLCKIDYIMKLLITKTYIKYREKKLVNKTNILQFEELLQFDKIKVNIIEDGKTLKENVNLSELNLNQFNLKSYIRKESI